MKLRPEALGKLLSDSNHDFTVIGTLGMQGTGKSSVLSLLGTREMSLLSETRRNTPSNQYVSSVEAATEAALQCRSEEMQARRRAECFEVQTLDTLLSASHQTVGLDVCVTADRLILVDCQPLLSASVILSLLKGCANFSVQFISSLFVTLRHFASAHRSLLLFAARTVKDLAQNLLV